MAVPTHIGHAMPEMDSGLPRRAIASSLYDLRPDHQPIYSARNPTAQELPYSIAKSYLTFIYDPSTGQVIRQYSPELTQFRHSILDDVSRELRRFIHNSRSQHVPMESKPTLQLDTGPRQYDRDNMYGDLMALDETVKRRRSDTTSTEPSRRSKGRLHKIKKIKSRPITADDDCTMPNASFTSTAEPTTFAHQDTVTHDITATSEWEKWFCDAFRAVQQLGCRTMAKEWIKIIHPKKQSTNPYNGKKLKSAEGNPESTKPAYWPKDVVHREPDHINKEDRTNLLLHLLMGTPHTVTVPPGGAGCEKEVNAKHLMAALEGKYDDKKHGLQGRRDLVAAIIHVRTTMEDARAGGFPNGCELTMPDYANFRKPHLTDDNETTNTTHETLDMSPQADDYNDGDTIVLTPVSNHDSSMTTELPMQSEAPAKPLKKSAVRNKTKRKTRPQDLGEQNVSFVGSTVSMESQRMLSTSFGADQIAQHPRHESQATAYFPGMWNTGMPPTPHSMEQYSFPHFDPPDPRSAHSQTHYPVDQYVSMPVPAPPYQNMTACYPHEPFVNMGFVDGPNANSLAQTAYAYGLQIPPSSQH